jgi:pentatricopeptide repeat protein
MGRLEVRACNNLMHGLAKHGRADLCQSLYDRVFRSHSICVADVATFTSLMLGYINSGQIQGAMEIYHVLREQHYRQQQQQQQQQQAQLESEQHQQRRRPRRPIIELDAMFYTTLISALTASASTTSTDPLDSALELFKDMRQLRIQPGLQTYTAMLHWCGRMRDPEGLEQVHQLIKMDMALDPDVGIYNALMDGYNRTDQIDQVFYLWDTMQHKEFDSSTVSIVLDACGHHNQYARGQSIWAFLQKRRQAMLNTNNYNSYVEFLCRVGRGSYEQRWLAAYQIVQLMAKNSALPPPPNDKTFNTMASFARKYGLDQTSNTVIERLAALQRDRKRLNV